MSTQSLTGCRIAVGVSGGIAAYKVCDYIRELGRQGASVRVAMTRAAQEFVTPLTLQSLSGHEVLVDNFDRAQEEHFGHLHLARWADAFVLAPATADLIARVRAGMANDAVTTSLLAFRGPVLIAPAMNTAMWENSQTQANIRRLVDLGRFHVVGPASGPLADGDVGPGRLADQSALVEATRALFASGTFSGRKVLISAGPTREMIDPVRFISNPSTGRMGLAIAECAHQAGAEVTVILGPTEVAVPSGVQIDRVTSADDMLAKVMSYIDTVDVFVSAAAVGDWKPLVQASQKIKKTLDVPPLALTRTPDILALVSERVQAQPRRPILVGFAAETENLLGHAKEKLHSKRLDLIVANDVTRPNAGFAGENNEVIIVRKDQTERCVRGTKREVARTLLDEIAACGVVNSERP